MTAPYAPQSWADLPATTTPISAARLIVIENGVARYSTVQSSGSNMTARSVLNITGSGVTVTDNSGATPPRTDVTITAGGGGSVITTRGDLIAGDAFGAAARLSPVALTAFDGDYLTYDSTQALGYRYLTPPAAPAIIHEAILPVRATNPSRGQIYTNIANDNPMDGVTLVPGDRIWYQHDSTPGDSRVLIVLSDGSMVPATDMPNGSKWRAGLGVYIQEGNAKGGHTYYVAPSDGSATWTANPYPSGPTLTVTDTPVIGTAKVLPAGSILGSSLPIYNVPASGYSKIVLTADATVCFTETANDAINEFRLVIEQDSVGGHNVIFSPRTIAWAGGVEPKIDMAPKCTTYIRGQWLGINYGMAAEATSMSWYKRRLPNVYNGVTLGIGIEVMRGTSEAGIRFAVNWLNRYSNLTHRQTLGNNGAILQYSDAWSQDCPLAGGLRGSAYQFYYGFTVTGGSVIRSGTVPYGDGTGHEYYHAEHNYYFYPTYTDTGGGAYAPYNGRAYALLDHPVTRDCWYRAYNAVSTRTIACSTTSGSAIVTTAGAFLVPGAQTYSDVSGSCPTAGISGTGIPTPTRTVTATTSLGMGEFTFASGVITSADIGSIVTGTGIAANTGIVAMGSVANAGLTTTAILSRMATASGTITLTIQNQTRVASVQSSTQLTMSANATATQSGVSLTITWATGNNGSNLAEWWAQTRQTKKMIDAGDAAIIDTKIHVAGGDATVITDFENFIAHTGIVGG